MSYTVDPTGSSPQQSLRALIAERRPAYGAWCMIPSPLNVEVIAAAGVDWLCIDTQHGLIDQASMHQMIQAAQVSGTPVIVRVPWNEPSAIMRALDGGADGVIVPMVNGASEARAAAAATRFPPDGIRSWGPLRPAMLHAGFSPELGNELAVCLVMVETVQAVAELDAILDTAGVDGIFVGPKDLALSHRGSLTGSIDADIETFRLVADGCRSRGLVAATICDTVEQAERLRALGFTLLALQTDASWLAGTAAARMETIRSSEPKT